MCPQVLAAFEQEKNGKAGGARMSIPDKDGFAERECPGCQGYFAIGLRSGQTLDRLVCYCPYCGHRDSPVCFWTQEQVNRCLAALAQDAPGAPCIPPIAGKELATDVVCDQCTVRFLAYGVFSHCPDCGLHIVEGNPSENCCYFQDPLLAYKLRPKEARGRV